MPSLFGVDIAGELAAAMGSGLLPVTLTRPALTDPMVERDPVDLSAGLALGTPTSYACRGFTDVREDRFGVEGTVIRGGTYVSVLGGTLPPGVRPLPGWGISITEDGVTRDYTICDDGVSSDPAAAVFRCRVEGA